MSVELRERKWCGVLEIEKVGVEGCWMGLTIVNGLTAVHQNMEIVDSTKNWVWGEIIYFWILKISFIFI